MRYSSRWKARERGARYNAGLGDPYFCLCEDPEMAAFAASFGIEAFCKIQSTIAVHTERTPLLPNNKKTCSAPGLYYALC